MVDKPIIEAAKTICSLSLSGFCANVGGHMGCENGRGGSGAHLCKASLAQLQLAGHIEMAEKVAIAVGKLPNNSGALDALRNLRRTVEESGLAQDLKFKEHMDEATIVLGRGY